jgi:hypothetical protein
LELFLGKGQANVLAQVLDCQHAEALIARELLRPRKKEALLESIGLIEIVYPGVAGMGVPAQLEVDLSRELRNAIRPIWPYVVALVLDTVRADGCLDWTDDSQEGRKWLDESPLQGRWLTQQQTGWNARALVGRTPRQFRRQFVANVLRSAGSSETTAERLSEVALEALFGQLCEQAQNGPLHWLRFNRDHQVSETTAVPALQISMDGLSVRKPMRLFRCETTGTLWSHTALGWVYEQRFSLSFALKGQQ